MLQNKHIAAYLRVSTDKQDSTRQRDSIEQWAIKQGAPIAYWFADVEGKNSRDKADKRIDFQRMLKFVESGVVDVVIVDSQDRFGVKDNAQFWKYIDQLREQGCELWSVAQGNLSKSDDGTILSSTVGALTSSREQKEKSLRSLSGKIQTARAGEYTGGYPPFGTDVVCTLQGVEKWRLVWVGNHQRIKLNPDGSTQEYNGKDNVPGKDLNDVLKYSPSIRTERLKTIHEIFTWFTTESISPGAIAARLKKAGVDPVFKSGWIKQKIKEILKNPVYIGFPAINKRAGGRFWEYVNGELRLTEPIKGKIKAGRRRQKSDYIMSNEQIFEPIIPVEMFNSAQIKLQKLKDDYEEKVPNRRPSRVGSFWLRNLAYCAHCNTPLRAWNATERGLAYRSYFCGTYGTHGKDNPTGCKSNRIKADFLEMLVDVYLSETEGQIAKLIDASKGQTSEVCEMLDEGLDSIRSNMFTALRQISKSRNQFESEFGRTELEKIELIAEPNINFVPDSCKVFDQIYAIQKPKLELELKTLDEEHSLLVSNVLKLPTGAKSAHAKANARILELESRMDEIRQSLIDWSNQVSSLQTELLTRKEIVSNARKSISDDSSFRRKSELVKQVVSKIVCHYETIETKGKQVRSHIKLVEIFPTSGGCHPYYPNGVRAG